MSALLLAALAACSPSADSGPGGSPSMSAAGGHGSEGVGPASSTQPDLVATIDSIVMAPIRAGDVSGISVAVVRGSDTIAIRGYGWADLELEVPTPERAIYEIGSVTKQFTSVALLQLQDEGLVDLDAEIGTYLPDFPTQGNRITVRELLDHTSGIRGYTEMPEAYPYFIRRVERDSLVALFAEHPFDFPTGEHMIYNNSAFYLAGMIIEEVTGESYEDYVEQRIFEALDMDDSQYCSEREIQPGKVKGYEASEDGLVHKGFIVHNIPYAAGSLCSSAWDMARWLEALHGGEVLSQDAYQQLIDPADLNDGTQLRYALGIAMGDIAGHHAIHHGGGINGFLTQTLYIPAEDLSVAVLMSTAGPPGPDPIAEDLVKAVLGDATPDPTPLEGDLSWYEGTYTAPARGQTLTLRVAADGEVLTLQAIGPDGEPTSENTDTLTYRGDRTFTNGQPIVTFDGGDDQADVLRYDVVFGLSVLRRVDGQ